MEDACSPMTLSLVAEMRKEDDGLTKASDLWSEIAASASDVAAIRFVDRFVMFEV